MTPHTLKSAPQQVEPQHIFYFAQTYRHATIAITLAARDRKPWLHFAAFSNGALALELFFKTILRAERTPYRGTHDLRCMFDKISPANQNLIRQLSQPLIDLQVQRDTVLFADSGIAVPSTFDQILDRSSRAFERIRYLYEQATQPTGDAGFWIGPIIEGTHQTIMATFPEWAKPLDSSLPGCPPT